jgi:hypothetical protein
MPRAQPQIELRTAAFLLGLDWSPVVPHTCITYPEGHPDGLTQSRRMDYVEASFAIGPDETGHIQIPNTALELLRRI